MTVSYLPLIRAQQRPHLPKIVDRHFSSSLDILEAGRAARERLMGRPVVELPKPAPVPEPEPVVEVVEPDIPDLPELPVGVPLDMLLPCSWKFLLALAAVRNGVTPADIVGSSRKREILTGRQEAMALIYQHTAASTTGVGRLLDRDHTTVVHALQKRGVEGKLLEVPLPAQAQYRPKKGPERAARLKAVEKVIRRGYEEGTSCQEIADQAGVSKAYVTSTAYRLGLKHPKFMAARPSRLLKIMSQEQLDHYRHLTQKQGLTAAEARSVVGVRNA